MPKVDTKKKAVKNDQLRKVKKNTDKKSKSKSKAINKKKGGTGQQNRRQMSILPTIHEEPHQQTRKRKLDVDMLTRLFGNLALHEESAKKRARSSSPRRDR